MYTYEYVFKVTYLNTHVLEQQQKGWARTSNTYVHTIFIPVVIKKQKKYLFVYMSIYLFVCVIVCGFCVSAYVVQSDGECSSICCKYSHIHTCACLVVHDEPFRLIALSDDIVA